MGLEFEELTERIIGAAIEVHRQLGPGFLEAIYHKALLIELAKRGLRFTSKAKVEIQYDGIDVGLQEIDLLVEDTMIVELKAVKAFEDIFFAVVKSYLRALNKKHGLLINFAKSKVDVRRVINDFAHS